VGKVVEEELMTISIRNDLTDSCEAGMVILGQPSESDRWSRDRATIVVVDGTCFRLHARFCLAQPLVTWSAVRD
jgi:hypothetical protein